MRLDRWFAVHFPGLPFGRVQKLIRTGQVRVDKGRAQTNTRLEAGQEIRVPPITAAEKPEGPRINTADAQFLSDLILYEDDDVFVFNKPHGLAVQGGSGTKRHIDGMMKSLVNKAGDTPRLVHRLDRDTSGVLLGRPHPRCRHPFRQGLPHAFGPQDLLGRDRRRAGAASGQDLVLSGQAADP